MFIVFPWIYNLKCMGGWSENRFVSVYILVVTTYAITRWAFGDGLGIGLDLFGLSIGLWVISECLHKFWSPTFRLASGFVGFVVAAVFGILPMEILQDPENFHQRQGAAASAPVRVYTTAFEVVEQQQKQQHLQQQQNL